MKKLIGLTGLGALVLAGGVAVAQTGGGKLRGDADGNGVLTRAEVTAQADARFAKRDKDGDGRITQADRAAAMKERADKRFARLDANGDGSISRAEFDAPREKRAAQAGEDGPGKRKWGHRRGGHRMMAMRGGMDPDKDGAITRDESRARALAMFDRLDANKDGQVTAEERQAARDAWKAKRAERRQN